MARPDRGWIIFNHGIPVFPTLFTTRKECISRFRARDGMTKNEWRAMVRRGTYQCRKVDMEFPYMPGDGETQQEYA